MITIRKMQPEDIQAIAALEAECFSLPWTEEALAPELNNPLSFWLVAVDGQALVGYVGSQSVMGEADMMNLAVTPLYRRQGVARKLVSTLIEELARRTVSSLTLEVRASNENAISLYKTLGFSQVGRRPRYYTRPKEDALILRKEWDV